MTMASHTVATEMPMFPWLFETQALVDAARMHDVGNRDVSGYQVVGGAYQFSIALRGP